jgi:hypothetical protein
MERAEREAEQRRQEEEAAERQRQREGVADEDGGGSTSSSGWSGTAKVYGESIGGAVGYEVAELALKKLAKKGVKVAAKWWLRGLVCGTGIGTGIVFADFIGSDLLGWW